MASTITPPFSSVTKRKDWVALNAIEQSLCAEIATEPDNFRAGGSPPPANFKGFWEESCNSTLDRPPPPKKKNLASMQKFTGFKPLEIGVSKMAKTRKGFEGIVVAKVRRTDELANKACSSLQECTGAVASLSKRAWKTMMDLNTALLILLNVLVVLIPLKMMFCKMSECPVVNV
ncbi:hypothetical protein PQX77_015743 [Marasmius sp. AFHP31]|nr:hypothetical protein PQX77_015743 [Marasmius sp. AFHP31]